MVISCLARNPEASVSIVFPVTVTAVFSGFLSESVQTAVTESVNAGGTVLTPR